MQELKFGCMRRNDDPRSESPLDATTPEVIRKVLGLVADENTLEVYEDSSMVHISTERVYNILHTHLTCESYVCDGCCACSLLSKSWKELMFLNTIKRNLCNYLRDHFLN